MERGTMFANRSRVASNNNSLGKDQALAKQLLAMGAVKTMPILHAANLFCHF